MKNCNTCGRYPFCDYMEGCKYCNYSHINLSQNENYWLPRENKEVEHK